MALDIKSILADGMLSLCETIPLSSMTIKDLLNKTTVSRQAFYNHFRDKEDLIQWIYVHKILGSFNDDEYFSKYYENTLEYYQNVAKYHRFMKQAVSMKGQNCLSDFMINFSIEYDKRLYEKLSGKKPLPDDLAFASTYHSMATISSCIAWIMSDMPFPPETMAKYMVTLRDINLGQSIFGEGTHFHHQDKNEKFE